MTEAWVGGLIFLALFLWKVFADHGPSDEEFEAAQKRVQEDGGARAASYLGGTNDYGKSRRPPWQQ